MPGDRGRYPNNSTPSKPPSPPGISSAEAGQLRAEVARLKKLVEEHLAEKNQWNAEVRTWVGAQVFIKLTNEDLYGTLLWLDRYTISISGPSGPEIIHKAHVVRMRKM